MNRYWYRNIRWGVFFSTLGILLVLGSIAFWLYLQSSRPDTGEITRIGVETYTGDGRKDVTLSSDASLFTVFGAGGVDHHDAIAVNEETFTIEDEVESFNPTDTDSNFTGGNFVYDGSTSYFLYFEQDVMTVNYSELGDFYVNGISVADGSVSVEFDSSLLRMMRNEAAQNDDTLVTYGTVEGINGQTGAYVITEIDNSPASDSGASPLPDENTELDDISTSETPTSDTQIIHYGFNMYLWNDENVMNVSGITTSNEFPSWLTSLQLG